MPRILHNFFPNLLTGFGITTGYILLYLPYAYLQEQPAAVNQAVLQVLIRWKFKLLRNQLYQVELKDAKFSDESV